MLKVNSPVKADAPLLLAAADSPVAFVSISFSRTCRSRVCRKRNRVVDSASSARNSLGLQKKAEKLLPLVLKLSIIFF